MHIYVYIKKEIIYVLRLSKFSLNAYQSDKKICINRKLYNINDLYNHTQEKGKR